MEQKQKNFKEQLAIGKEGEHEIGNYFMNKNYSILPLYQFEDNIAPKVFTLNNTLTSPDMFISGNNKCFWVEVKTKFRWVNYNNIIETGINEKHYRQYLSIAEKTTLPIYLIFNHKKTPPIGYFYIDIKTPYNRIWDGINIADQKYISQPMVFWKYEDLIKIN